VLCKLNCHGKKKYIQTRIHFDVIEQENVIISNKHWKQKMIFLILGFGALHNTREVTIKSVSVFFQGLMHMAMMHVDLLRYTD